MQQLFYNGKILIDNHFREDCAIVVENGVIVDVCYMTEINSNDYKKIDLKGFLLIPGLIDIQVNGGGGVLFNQEITLEGVNSIVSAHAKYGTTACLPTLITDDCNKMDKAISVIQDCLTNEILGVLGIHLEGPYLNKRFKGVHKENKIIQLTQQAVESLCQIKKGTVLITLAPENVKKEFIKQLSRSGIKVFAGHTSADYQQTLDAIASGVIGFTHLFNAMPDMHKRNPGIVVAALEDDQTYCGIIADGFHVDYAMLRLAINAKDKGKMILVTDAMPSVGSTEKTFELFGQNITCTQGKCLTDDGILAGSDLDMLSAVRNSVNNLNLSLEEAVNMASLYPAKLLEVEDKMGQISIGKQANFVQITPDIFQLNTWINGQKQ